MITTDSLAAATAAIRNASALVITAGAGMGVDSGLPDFRGNQGFWAAYPMYERLGLSFIQAANPEHFEADPHFGWGFYGHRTNLYRNTTPHQGFAILQNWITVRNLDYFIVTSNVDGQFQKAGFDDDHILEVHGSIHYLQCTVPCCSRIWPSKAQFEIDEATMRAAQIPRCPHCSRVARPNILMFGDYSWLPQRETGQETCFDDFLTRTDAGTTVVIELGAGSAIPTIRNLSHRLGHRSGTRVIRINPREAQIDSPHFGFSGGAVDILSRLDNCLTSP